MYARGAFQSLQNNIRYKLTVVVPPPLLPTFSLCLFSYTISLAVLDSNESIHLVYNFLLRRLALDVINTMNTYE